MKPVLIALLALVVAAGCGKKEPELRSEKVITPGEAANKLFVESTLQMAEAVSKDDKGNIDGAVADYGKVLVKVRKIVSDYPESDIAVKLVSGEALFTGKSLKEIEERVIELQRELTRRAEEEKRRAVAEAVMRKARVKLLLWEFETGGTVRSSPAIGSDGTVYVGSWDGKLYAINGKNGVKL